MLMVITGIAGLVITIIAAIVLLRIMRKNELKYRDMGDKNLIANDKELKTAISPRTDIIGTESMNNNVSAANAVNGSAGTDILVSEQAAIAVRTDVLESQGTEVLTNRTTVISD